MTRARKIALVAGEESGDQLGGALMAALRARIGQVSFVGVGGRAMEAQGLASFFPLTEIAVMGILPVLRRLPSLIRRVHDAVAGVVAAEPDVLVIIDSPDFTHAVAKRVRKQRPDLPIVDYVSPSVWAWRPGRARKMRAYVDHLLALLPFEPAVHERLGGPPTTYVGHSLIERLDTLRPMPGERPPLDGARNVLVLPGSRRSEITRLMAPFGAAIAEVASRTHHPLRLILPAVPHLADAIAEAARSWPVQPEIVRGEAEKYAAFRSAQAALAASGTVTLELALAAVPMVVAYKVSKLEEQLKHVIDVPSIVLPNLVLGENVIPERLQAECDPAVLARDLAPLLDDTPERGRQLEAFAKLDALMETGGEKPSARAARIVCEVMERGRGRAP